MQLIATISGADVHQRQDVEPEKAIAVSVATATRCTKDARDCSTRKWPKRRSRCGLSCAQQIRPKELAPKIMAKRAGERPKPWMKTGDDPPRYAKKAKVAKAPIEAWVMKLRSVRMTRQRVRVLAQVQPDASVLGQRVGQQQHHQRDADRAIGG